MGLENLQHLLEHVRPTVLFQIGDIPITTTVFNTWIVMLILLPVVYFLSRRLQTIPRVCKTYWSCWQTLSMAFGRYHG